jgi:hypothetical protein
VRFPFLNFDFFAATEGKLKMEDCGGEGKVRLHGEGDGEKGKFNYEIANGKWHCRTEHISLVKIRFVQCFGFFVQIASYITN